MLTFANVIICMLRNVEAWQRYGVFYKTTNTEKVCICKTDEYGFICALKPPKNLILS